MPQNIPTRAELIEKLKLLRSQGESRFDIATWAIAIINDDSIRVTDRVAWSCLTSLGAVDLPAPDRDFLFTELDFEKWQFELENK